MLRTCLTASPAARRDYEAGLAGVALERREQTAARAALAPVLVYLAENPTLDGAMHPYRVPLVCGQVLLALGELAQAREVVEAACRAWAAIAEKLPTPAERERFRQAPEYAALRHLWAELDEHPGQQATDVPFSSERQTAHAMCKRRGL
jgi:hypothetical protein